MPSKVKLIIIAGPQSSGKTTVFNLLKKHYPNATFLPEINPYTLNKNHLGAAYVATEMERQLIEKDISQLKNFKNFSYHLSDGRLQDGNIEKTLIIIETGIFHLLYLETMFDQKTVDFYYQKYLEAHRPFHPIILFIDTKPQISWQRRKKYYHERIKKINITDLKEKQKMFEKYKQKIFQLYPLWLKWYQKLPFEKYMIRNSYKSYERFVKEIIRKVKATI